MTENPFFLLDQIRTEPSESAWEGVLRLTMQGQLAAYIEAHYGAAEEMVLTLIENSRDKVRAEQTFQTVLERLCVDFDPALLTGDNSREAVLRLLQAFHPESGRGPLLAYAVQGGTFTRFRIEDGRAGLSYLDGLAWNALQAYFPINDESPEKQRAYDTYVRFLRGSLSIADVRSLACIRLLELGEWKLDSEKLRELVDEHPSTLVPELVDWLLSSNRRDRHEIFEALYQHCTDSTEAMAALETTVLRLGGSLDRDKFTVTIGFGYGEALKIHSVARTFVKAVGDWDEENAWLQDYMMGEIES